MGLLTPPDELPRNADEVTVFVRDGGLHRYEGTFFVMGRVLHLGGSWVILLGRLEPQHAVEVPASAFVQGSTSGTWTLELEDTPPDTPLVWGT